MTDYEEPQYHTTEEESKLNPLVDPRYNDEPVAEHDKNFILKVYDTFLTNMAVQKGMKKINKISQPILNIYHELLDDRILDIKNKSQEVLNTTKEKLTIWLYNVNMYSHLVGLWILQNSPFSQDIITEEQFLESFKNFYHGRRKYEPEDVMQVAKTFYSITADAWSKLKEPSVEDIKNVLIKAVAKTIGRDLGFNDDFYAGNLTHTFKDMVEKQKQLVSDERFCEVVRKMTGHAWVDESSMKKATYDFYTFAKRFTLIDLPMVVNTKSVSKALISYVQEFSKYYTENAMGLVDEYLDKVMSMLEIKKESEENAVSLRQKSRNIARKVSAISQAVADKSLEYVQNNKVYLTVDQYVDFKQRMSDITFIMVTSLELLRVNVYQPTRECVSTSYDKLQKQYTVVMEGLNMEVVKEQILKIREGYEYLKEATFVLKEKTLEIRFDQESLKHYRDEIKKSLEKLYDELKTGDQKRIKKLACSLYEDAITTLKARRTYREMRAIEKSKTE